MRYYMIQDLKVFAARYLTHWNVSEEDAALAADVLVSADMRGGFSWIDPPAELLRFPS